jgi:O-antigen ligase
MALVSLLALAGAWWRRGALSLAELVRRPAFLFAAALAVAVVPGGLLTAHPGHWARATTSLAIALACVVLWNLELGESRLRRALDALTLPAVALSLLAAAQAHGIFRPFAFSDVSQEDRLGLTSLAGNVGDLGAYLVLPALVLQAALMRSARPAGRVVAAAMLAFVVYALFLSQTLTALAAAIVGSALLWTLLLQGRRRWWIALVPAVAVACAFLVPAVERRAERKLDELLAGDLDSVLAGRPDGWKAALAMFKERPLVGLGHGTYRCHFAPTKLRLVEGGATFWSRGQAAHFANAHNEPLELLAGWGLWGVAALAAAAYVVGRSVRDLRRAAPADGALAAAGCAALAVLALASFPLRMALTGYPWVLFAAWLLRAGAPGAAGGGRLRAPARVVAVALAATLAGALAIHGRALLGRLEASRIRRTTTEVARLAMRSGAAAARPVLQVNLRPLRRAAELDPIEAGVPMAIGSHYLLLGNGPAALDAYRRGLEIEPRSTLYLNQARALLELGRRDQAMASIAQALVLDPALLREARELGWRDPDPPASLRGRAR